MKTIKIAASTHERLTFLTDVFDGATISSLIDGLIDEVYPEVDENKEKLESEKDAIRSALLTRRPNDPLGSTS